MAICPSCGGVIGRDCFNSHDCEMITQQLDFDPRYTDDDRVTPDKLKDLGFKKDSFGAWNKDITPWPETQVKQLSFAGDYLYIREGIMSEPREEDDLVTLWNNDLRGVMPVKQLKDLYYILTGSLLQGEDDLPF